MVIKKCTLNPSYNSYMHIAGNIFLFIIIILLLYYYVVYVKKDLKESFVSTSDSQTLQAELRSCQVYFVKPEKEAECDTYYKYYNMNEIELDRAIEETNNETLKIKLREIRNNKPNACKIVFNDWKEVKKIKDDEFNSFQVYPHKNSSTNLIDVDYNDVIWSSCFSHSCNLEKIDFSQNFVQKGGTTEIVDFSSIANGAYGKNEYSSMMFNSYAFNDILKVACQKSGNVNLDISDGSYFMSLECSYENLESLIVNNISFVVYNNINYTFEQVSLPNSDIQTIFNNLFVISYDSNKITYSPVVVSKDTYKLKYDFCKNIFGRESISIPEFSLKDFGIENINIENIDLNKDNELIPALNGLYGVVNKRDIVSTIDQLILNNQHYINDLNKSLDSNDEFSIFLKNIYESRISTDNAINEYKKNFENDKARELLNEKLSNEYDIFKTNMRNIVDIIHTKINQILSLQSYINVSLYTTKTNNDYDFINVINDINTTVPIKTYGKKHSIDMADFYKNINQKTFESYSIEMSANILLSEGYYNFFIDLDADEYNDSIGVYLGCFDRNKEMIFNNVAYFHPKDATKEYVEHPKIAATQNVNTNITISGNSTNTNYWNMFDKSEHTSWISDQQFVNGLASQENRTNYKGEYFIIDMKDSIKISQYLIQYNTLDSAPQKFRIYGTNNVNALSNINHESWVILENANQQEFSGGKIQNYVYNIEEPNDIIDNKSNMIAWYKFDNDTNDSSGNGKHLTIFNNKQGDTYDSNAKFNSAINFKKTQINWETVQTYLQNDTSDEYFTPEQMTISFWIYGGSASSTHQDIASAREEEYGGWILRILPRLLSKPRLSFIYGISGRWESFFIEIPELLREQWDLVTITIDNLNHAKMFFNGEEIGEYDFKQRNRSYKNFRIGAGMNEKGARFHLNNGTKLDDFRIYNKVLSNNDIRQIYIQVPTEKTVINTKSFRYYTFIVNKLNGNSAELQIKNFSLISEKLFGYTTKFPIKIDNSYNNGYYGIYVVSKRNSTFINKSYPRIAYKKTITNQTKSEIDLTQIRSYLFVDSKYILDSTTTVIDNQIYIFNNTNSLLEEDSWLTRQGRISSNFYITCPKLPRIPILSPKIEYNIQYSVFGGNNIINLVQLLENELRNFQFEDIDCMFKSSLSEFSTINSIKIQIEDSENKNNNLKEIKQSIEAYKINFDMNKLNEIKSLKLSSSKYLSSVFKHSDDKYYLYIKL